MIGTQVLSLNQTESTNTFCKTFLYKSPTTALGLAVYTLNQTDGRGQRNTLWQSELGKNLTFSVIADCSFINGQQLFTVTQTVSVILCAFLHKLNLPVKIKWPNDIYVNNKKIAGILIETVYQSPTKITAIIGVGLNVNQTQWQSNINATSILIESKKEIFLPEILNEILNDLDAAFLNLKTNLNYFNKTYLTYLLGLDEERCFTNQTKTFRGKIIGVTAEGKLLIEHLENNLPKATAYDLKEIKFEF
ncbi:MAG: biotin--[acetyl-CoA-carboxylase] ligase [Bacteroidia bacterium]|nr:biotin--[acetyl-CoA-carboxylase] ligase [Bacteroidia bacterium]